MKKNIWITGLGLLCVNLFERLLLRALPSLTSDHPEFFSSIVDVVSALQRGNMDEDQGQKRLVTLSVLGKGGCNIPPTEHFIL